MIIHNAVIATTWNKERADSTRSWIASLSKKEQNLFMISNEKSNGYITIICGPDGSKEGRPESDAGDALRETFIQHIEEDKYDEDNETSPWNWVEVEFGECGQKLIRGNCED